MEERPKLEFDPEKGVEFYSLWEVIQGMPIENVSGKRSKLEQIGKRQVGKKQSSPTDGKRFFVQLWKIIFKLNYQILLKLALGNFAEV